MEIYNETVWVIMTKCRKYIAKGTPRNRELVEVKSNCKKRFLTYSSKAKAEAGFKLSGFYTYSLKDFPYNTYGVNRSEYLEAVECRMKMEII
jgi:hypothetical protein